MSGQEEIRKQMARVVEHCIKPGMGGFNRRVFPDFSDMEAPHGTGWRMIEFGYPYYRYTMFHAPDGDMVIEAGWYPPPGITLVSQSISPEEAEWCGFGLVDECRMESSWRGKRKDRT